jgi:hypothetical protein
MRRYSQVVEESIRAQAQVRDWTRAGLLDPSQRARLESELRVDVKRTNVFLRAGLALFTALIVGALVALIVDGLDPRSPTALALATGLPALACIGLAELLVGRLRFYRFGVEEALAVAAVFLLSFSVAALVSEPQYGLFRAASWIAGLLVGTAGGFGIYRRFGFVYAAIGSMACAAAIPFQMNLSPAARHALSAATLALVFVAVRWKRLQYEDDYPGDEYGQLQAAALAGIYIVLNLQLSFDLFDRTPRLGTGAFYWFTYLMTWVLPIVGLRLGIRERDRALMDVSLVMALVTLLTNKPYLGWPRHTWDPVLLGFLLMAVAIVLRRWLSNGPGGERRGFTPAPLLGKDSAMLTVLKRHLPRSSRTLCDRTVYQPLLHNRRTLAGAAPAGAAAVARFEPA